MIRHLSHNDIDTQKWDQCIDMAFNGMIYANSWYLDMVNESWEALVENDYERVMPLTPGRKYGINYLFQPRFTQQLGIFSTSKLSEEVVRTFLDAIPSKYRYVDISLNIYNYFTDAGKFFTPWINHELDLIGTYEAIAASYSSNLRRNLKKAQQAGITITKNINPDEVITLFRNNKGKQLQHLTDKDYLLLKRIVYSLIYRRKAVVTGAFTATNDLCAGVVFVFDKHKTIFYFSATGEMARETGAMPLLIDTFIRENTPAHLTLDFEGSNDPQLARFYKSFGSKELHYPHYTASKLNPIHVLAFRIARWLKKY